MRNSSGELIGVERLGVSYVYSSRHFASHIGVHQPSVFFLSWLWVIGRRERGVVVEISQHQWYHPTTTLSVTLIRRFTLRFTIGYFLGNSLENVERLG